MKEVLHHVEVGKVLECELTELKATCKFFISAPFVQDMYFTFTGQFLVNYYLTTSKKNIYIAIWSSESSHLTFKNIRRILEKYSNYDA